MHLIRFIFPKTIPVLIGYFVLGTAYGVLMEQEGFSLFFTFLTSLLFFAGSAQYIAIGFLAAGINPLYAFIAFFILNARHLFYAMSMIKPYRNITSFWKRQYAIFSLTDEAFSILHDIDIPNTLKKDNVYVGLSFMQHIYWVIFGVIGHIFGQMMTFNTNGLDFVLTALFLVIFINQWNKSKTHRPALLGLVAALVALVLIGPERFLTLAMLLIVLTLLVFKDTFKEGIR